MQSSSGVRPNFVCTVCHQQYDALYDFKQHLESQEHELAYGIRLKNSSVGSYFCNCCHICVNTLLIWKSHIMGMKHMKIACAFSLAYSNFDFDKPARVSDVGVLDQNVEIPESLQRSTGKPSTYMRTMDASSYVIGVTDIDYNGPGLYHCRLCDDPFNEGNKSQHLTSTRHRVNVFRRWDMALYEEAMNAKDVGKPEFSERCESIAADIFPVEQNVLNQEQTLLYKRIMGIDASLDERFIEQKNPPPARPGYQPVMGGGRQPQNNPSYNDGQRPMQAERPMPQTRHPGGRGMGRGQQGGPSMGRGQPGMRRGSSHGEMRGPPDRVNQPQQPQQDQRYDQRRGGPPPHGRGGQYVQHRGGHSGMQNVDRGMQRPANKQKELKINSDVKCDIALECVRALMQNMNIYQAETRDNSFTRVEVLKAQILFDEVIKMAYPPSAKSTVTDDNYITMFQNGRLTLKRKEEILQHKKADSLGNKDVIMKAEASKEHEHQNRGSKEIAPVKGEPIKPIVPPTELRLPPPIPGVMPTMPPIMPPEIRAGGPMMPADLSRGGPMLPPPDFRGAPMMPPPQAMLDPWGRPVMVPRDMHGVPFLPPPDFYSSRRKDGRESSPRKRTPSPPAVGSDGPRDMKRNRSRTPDRVVTVKDRLGLKLDTETRISRSPTRKVSPRRSQNRRSLDRKSPPARRSPIRKSPSRKSPGRKSPIGKTASKKSPSRKKSPGRKSPRRKSPKRSPQRGSKTTKKRSRSPDRRNRRSPPRNKEMETMEDGDGTLFLDEGAYAELLNSLG